MDTRSMKGQREPVFPSPFGHYRLRGDLFSVEARAHIVDVCNFADAGNRAVSPPLPVLGHLLGDIQNSTYDGQKIRFSQWVLDEGCAPSMQRAEFRHRRFRNLSVRGHRQLERIAQPFQTLNTRGDCSHPLEVFKTLHPDWDVERKNDADDGRDHLNPCSPRCLIHCPELPFGSPKMIAGGPAAGKLGRCCP